jgi:hypothetical protein
MNAKQLKIGWAQTSITPDGPVLMEGQMYMRCSEYVHDPITATALALDNGEAQAIFVSMDMTEVPVHAFEGLRQRLSQLEVPFDHISFNVTHTHTSSSFYQDFMRVENEQVYDPAILPHFEFPKQMLCGARGQKFFIEKIASLIESAWHSRVPGGISAVHEYAAVAFNRRPQFGPQEQTIMYGDCAREDFQRFESGVDTSVELLYTWDDRRELTGVVCNVPCPSQVYELHSFLSADYWGPTRSEIRRKLRKNVYVLPLCGAAGDLAPIDLVRYSKTNRQKLLDWGGQSKEVLRNFDMTQICQGIGARISEAVVRGCDTAENEIEFSPVFQHEILSMELPIRQVSEEEYRQAQKQVEIIHHTFSAEHPMQMKDLVQAFEPQGVILRYRQQRQSPVFAFQCHILRLGNVAIATNPFELYHEYALRIKARAEAEQVFVVQLANGCGGYLPTRAAVAGGSYSSKPASTVCGPDGGDALVEKTLDVLKSLWV